MIRRKFAFAGFFILFLGGLFLTPTKGAEKVRLQPYRGIIHVHSTFSSGELTPAEIVSKAKSEGIQIVVFTDHGLIRGSWGLPPFRNLLSISRDFMPSVLQNGGDEYFKTIKHLQRENPNMVIIPGVEVSPFHHVTGNPILGEMKIHDWRRHMLLFGLSRKEVKNLPLPNNGLSGRYFWNLFPGTLLFLVPTLFAAVLLPFRGRTRWFGAVIFLIGVMGAIDAHPFKSTPFSPYLGSQGSRPHQELINYTNSKGGFALWAHQGSQLKKQKTPYGTLLTPPYKHLLNETVNYLGFDAVYEDNFTASHPGQEWDKNLVGYLNGIRPKPVWGYGGLDFHSEKELMGRKRLSNIQNVFMMDNLSKDAFFRSLINGRFYVVRGYTPARLQMDYFRVSSENGESIGSYGDGIRFKGAPRLSFQISTQDKSSVPVRARLIRMGQVVKTFQGKTPLRVEFKDSDTIPFKRFYYRLDVQVSRSEHIVTNPVFVHR